MATDNNRHLRWNVLIIPVLSLFLTASCRWPTDPEHRPEQIPISEIIQISRTGGNLPLLADGKTQDTIVALLPEHASTRTVAFHTTKGVFAITGDATDIKVVAISNPTIAPHRLRATAVLTADTIPAVAVVSATVGDYTVYLPVPFVKG